jgi:hypothetical protein
LALGTQTPVPWSHDGRLVGQVALLRRQSGTQALSGEQTKLV